MKNKVLICMILLFLLNVCCVFTLPFAIDDKYYLRAPHDVIKEGDKIGICFSEYEIKELKDYEVDADGWYTVSYCGETLHPIFGSNYYVYYIDGAENTKIDEERKEHYGYDDNFWGSPWTEDSFIRVKDFDRYIKGAFFWGDPEYEPKDTDGYFRAKKYIESIEVPDILTETTGGRKVVYDTYDMEHLYIRDFETGCVYYRYDAKPWATSKEPVGMTVKMNFYKPLDRIVILNGYVHPEKRYLYRQNRRMKKIRITNPEKTFEVVEEIVDVVHFHEIRLPEAVKTAEIEILEYYEGEKYKDLCVQMFGVRGRMFQDNLDLIELEAGLSYGGRFKQYKPQEPDAKKQPRSFVD